MKLNLGKIWKEALENTIRVFEDEEFIEEKEILNYIRSEVISKIEVEKNKEIKQKIYYEKFKNYTDEDRWSLSPFRDDCVNDDGGVYIGNGYFYGFKRADAQLIACAPKLLKRCILLEKALDLSCERLDDIGQNKEKIKESILREVEEKL